MGRGKCEKNYETTGVVERPPKLGVLVSKFSNPLLSFTPSPPICIDLLLSHHNQQQQQQQQ